MAALASSPVPRSTTSSSTSMPRLGPGELLKSICTGGSCRREAYGLALPEEAGRAVGRRRRRGEAEVGPGRRGGHPPAGRADEEALADEERLVDVLDGLGRLADARWPGWTGPPARPRSARTARRARPGRPCRGRARRPRRWPGPALAASWSTVPSPRTSAKSRTRRSSRLAMRGVPRARRAISRHPSASTGTSRMRGRPLDDGLEVGRVVVVEPGDEAEAVAQRAGDQAGAGGGADQREVGDVEADRRGRPGPCPARCRAGSPPSPGRAPPRRPGTAGGSRR